jgi:hypothetical protein
MADHLLDNESDYETSSRSHRIYVLPFDGRTSSWNVWNQKYLARARGNKTGRRVFIETDGELTFDTDHAINDEEETDEVRLQERKFDLKCNDIRVYHCDPKQIVDKTMRRSVVLLAVLVLNSVDVE